MAGFSDYSTLLGSYVLEAKFIRRRPKHGAPNTRRAFITNSPKLLNSPKGSTILGFTGYGSGITGLGFNPASKDLILVWDILWQSFRLFSASNSQIITKIPVSNDKEINDFWLYFDKNIRPMTPDQKLQFMNS